MKKSLRVLIGPIEISGVAKGLSKGLNEIGVDAQLVLSFKHQFDYGGEKKRILLAIWQLLGQWRATPGQPFISKAMAVVIHRAWGFVVLFWALYVFNAFIFLYGQTLTETKLELIILKLFNKKIIFINVGSDFRPPYLDGALFPSTNKDVNVSRIARLALRTKHKILLHEKFADFIVSPPSSAHFHERPFINWFSMGVPAGFDCQSTTKSEITTTLRVLHSPSNPVAKGSDIIQEVVQQLIDEGAPLELVLLQGVSNSEVLNQLQRCDFVIDQVYSDIPMAVFGSEAARFAKPCIVAGYLADSVNNYISKEDIPPSLYIRPEFLRKAIEALITDGDFRSDLGLRAREFVSTRWACKAVAERYRTLLSGQAEPDWWFDPKTITYVGGCGLDIKNISKNLAVLIQTFGVKSLQVGDKPVLEGALVKLAQQAERGNPIA